MREKILDSEYHVSLMSWLLGRGIYSAADQKAVIRDMRRYGIVFISFGGRAPLVKPSDIDRYLAIKESEADNG